MDSDDYISRESNSITPNIAQFEWQLVVAKIDLVKYSKKHFPLNNSIFESNALKIQANYQ